MLRLFRCSDGRLPQLPGMNFDITYVHMLYIERLGEIADFILHLAAIW